MSKKINEHQFITPLLKTISKGLGNFNNIQQIQRQKQPSKKMLLRLKKKKNTIHRLQKMHTKMFIYTYTYLFIYF